MKPDPIQDARGILPYNMTNDYMFRAVLQTNNKVLRGLICSLLHLSGEEVVSVEITNPIILGDSATGKIMERRDLPYISDFLTILFSRSVPNFTPLIN